MNVSTRPTTSRPPAVAAPPSPRSPRLDPMVLGTFFCIVAAVGTSASNGCLRALTVECDRFWVLCVKESVATVLVGLWLVARRGRGVALPSRRALAALVAAGLATQLAGNLPCIWAFSVVGLTVALPVLFGTNLIAGAILGRVFLGEAVAVRSMVAIGLLIIAVVLLSVGAGAANEAIAAVADVPTGPIWVGLAIAGAALTGVVYCILAVVIRRVMNADASLMFVAFLVPALGTFSLGPLGLAVSGWEGITSVSGMELGLMLAAGAANLVSFVALIAGLRRVPVAQANVLGASQVAIGAVMGIALFGEPPGPWLVLGVLLTIIGMILIGRSTAAESEIPL